MSDEKAADISRAYRRITELERQNAKLKELYINGGNDALIEELVKERDELCKGVKEIIQRIEKLKESQCYPELKDLDPLELSERAREAARVSWIMGASSVLMSLKKLLAVAEEK